MGSMVSFFFFFSSLTFLCTIANAEERAPHGLSRENPTALSPSAYDFFHPTTTKNPIAKGPCVASSCSPLPAVAAQVRATEAHESKFSTAQNGRDRLGAGVIAGILFGLAFAVFLAMGVYYVFVARRANMSKANTVQSDV